MDTGPSPPPASVHHLQCGEGVTWSGTPQSPRPTFLTAELGLCPKGPPWTPRPVSGWCRCCLRTPRFSHLRPSGSHRPPAPPRDPSQAPRLSVCFLLQRPREGTCRLVKMAGATPQGWPRDRHQAASSSWHEHRTPLEQERQQPAVKVAD